MPRDRSRRAPLIIAGSTSITGCLGGLNDQSAGERPKDDLPSNQSIGERPKADLPDSCPVSTLADYDPPNELSREAVKRFITEYHEAYTLTEQFYPHESDFLNGTVTSIEPHQYGYVVVIDWSGVEPTTSPWLN